MKGFAEVRACAENLVGAQVLGVLGAIVIGEGSAQPPRVAAQPAGERGAHLTGALLRELGQTGVACLALDGNLKRVRTAPRDRRVRFPVPDAATRQDVGRPLANRDPSGNMSLLMAARVSPTLADAMGPDQARNEVARLRIDPLVDRLVADRPLRMAALQPARDKLGRPTAAETVFHVSTAGVVFKAAVASGEAVAILRTLVRLVGQVVAGVHRWGIASKLP